MYLVINHFKVLLKKKSVGSGILHGNLSAEISLNLRRKSCEKIGLRNEGYLNFLLRNCWDFDGLPNPIKSITKMAI